MDDLFRGDVGFYGPVSINDKNLGIPISPYMYAKKSDCNKIAGIVHRFGRSMPDRNALQDKYHRFAIGFIDQYVPKLTRDDVPSFDEWLQYSTYSKHRKDSLRETRDEMSHVTRDMCNSKSFIKDEGYGEMKNPRIINSPSDYFKVIIQPLQKAADEKMFHDPVMSKWFIKGTDPRTWVERMENTFGGAKVINTDFRSFECHHRGVFAKVIWHWQMHMYRNLFVSRAHKNLIHKLILGTNVNKMGNVSATIDETLMSGVAWTSSGNAVLNLTINCFLALEEMFPDLEPEELVAKAHLFIGLFEGDDGVFINVGQRDERAKELGVLLTFKKTQDYSTAEFCSMVVPRGETALSYDFRKAIQNFSILPVKYAGANDSVCKALVRAKAMSYKYMYGSSPIVGELALKLLEMTSGIDVSGVLDVLDDRKRIIVDKFLEGVHSSKGALLRERPVISWAARCNYAEVFGISPEQQLVLEAQIRGSKGPVLSLDISQFYDRQQLEMSMLYQSTEPGPAYYPLQANAFVRSIVSDGLKGTTRVRCARVDKAFEPCALPPGYGQ